MNTNKSIIETPVTISGFIIGILVTVITLDLTTPFFILSIPTAARVPITVAVIAEVTARMSVFVKAFIVALSLKSSTYHFVENPCITLVLFVPLNESTMSIIIGR